MSRFPLREVIRFRDCEEVALYGASWFGCLWAYVILSGESRVTMCDLRDGWRVRPLWLMPVVHVLGMLSLRFPFIHHGHVLLRFGRMWRPVQALAVRRDDEPAKIAGWGSAPPSTEPGACGGRF